MNWKLFYMQAGFQVVSLAKMKFSFAVPKMFQIIASNNISHDAALLSLAESYA